MEKLKCPVFIRKRKKKKQYLMCSNFSTAFYPAVFSLYESWFPFFCELRFSSEDKIQAYNFDRWSKMTLNEVFLCTLSRPTFVSLFNFGKFNLDSRLNPNFDQWPKFYFDSNREWNLKIDILNKVIHPKYYKHLLISKGIWADVKWAGFW